MTQGRGRPELQAGEGGQLSVLHPAWGGSNDEHRHRASSARVRERVFLTSPRQLKGLRHLHPPLLYIYFVPSHQDIVMFQRRWRDMVQTFCGSSQFPT